MKKLKHREVKLVAQGHTALSDGSSTQAHAIWYQIPPKHHLHCLIGLRWESSPKSFLESIVILCYQLQLLSHFKDEKVEVQKSKVTCDCSAVTPPPLSLPLVLPVCPTQAERQPVLPPTFQAQDPAQAL